MPDTHSATGFHDRALVATWLPVSTGHWDVKFSYTFENFFHPFVGELLGRLNRGSLADVMDAEWQEGLKRDFFEAFYQRPPDRLVAVQSSPMEIDVDLHGSYSGYNWELFFHIPLTVAVHLSKSRRFEQAQRWFHYIFDPTSTDTAVNPPKRFWQFRAFRSDRVPKSIDDLLALLSKPPAELSAEDQALRLDVLNGYAAILDRPFQPHVVARTRLLAYQYSVVMKYLDNLLAWGDDLFQQDTIESINEATQIYVLASNILGPRPQRVPPLGAVRPRTFAQLKAAGLDQVGNAMVDLESQFPLDFGAADSSAGDGAGPLLGIGRTLYFCVPRNEKLLGYWDAVADRLFKIRHCMNIQGVVRSLALFDPPLDPGMLVKAAAAGIDISSIVSGLNPPAGPVRCTVLIQKALEICSEVRGLGVALLAAFEKGDAEHLAIVRQGHEVRIQQMMQETRFLQWKNAEKATLTLLATRDATLKRLRYFRGLLGLSGDDPGATDLADGDLTRKELTEDNFDEAYAALVTQYDTTAGDQPFLDLPVAGDAKLHLSRNEDKELNAHLPLAKYSHLTASALETGASVLHLLPEAWVHAHFWGVGPSGYIGGGDKLAAAASSAAAVANALATWELDQAGMASRTAGYQRRANEWLFQHNQAAQELKQNGRQILTSLIAEQVARHDYETLKQQIDDSQEVSQFLQQKFTSEDLSLWMQGELSRLYYDYYRLAFDTARKAERAMKRELMRPELDGQDFVKFNYWDAGRKGLLAGEALHFDVKRMELAYLDSNTRELELTRHVSLRQLDPVALLSLRTNGVCRIDIPEWLYDKDCPGHYARRIKSVAVTIPAVVGPYTSLNCTLTLLSSSIRRSPLLSDDGEYARQGSDDDRFIDYGGAIQSIVTSSAVGDSGMFETNLRDDRLLPFEGAGAIGSWKLELPASYRAFDYGTISDVVLHIRYTARPGVEPGKVTSSLDGLFAGLSAPAGPGLRMLLSLAHDFPTEWVAFIQGTGDFTATVKRDYFPYFTQGRAITITGLELYDSNPARHHPVADPDLATTDLADRGAFVVAAPPDPGGPMTVLMRQSGLELFLVVRYTLG